MSYEKQTWNNGDTITAEKLNHIEDGIVQAGGIVLVTTIGGGEEEETVLNASYNDLLGFVNNGIIPTLKFSDDNSDNGIVVLGFVFSLEYNTTAPTENYIVQFLGTDSRFTADDPDQNMVMSGGK